MTKTRAELETLIAIIDDRLLNLRTNDSAVSLAIEVHAMLSKSGGPKALHKLRARDLDNAATYIEHISADAATELRNAAASLRTL